MKVIDGFITDKAINSGDYRVFETPGAIGLLYGSDTSRGTHVRTYVKNLPSFEEAYDCFLHCKNPLFKRNRLRDVCLSLFFQPYFSEFYDRLKRDRHDLSKSGKNFLKKYLLDYLADDIYYKQIMDFDVGGLELKQWYVEKDIHEKSKELLALLF